MGGTCRLDKRVAPFVRAHPFGESDTLLCDTKPRMREIYAWTADCEPPRESAADADGDHPNDAVDPAQHAQHGQHAERSWEDELRCALHSCGHGAFAADGAVVVQHGEVPTHYMRRM